MSINAGRREFLKGAGVFAAVSCGTERPLVPLTPRSSSPRCVRKKLFWDNERGLQR